MQRELAVLAIVGLLVVAGCLGTGNRTPQTIEASADRATVAQSALAATGYEEVAIEEGHVNATGTLEVSGDVELDVEYRVTATTWRAMYRPTNGAGVFSVYSVPLANPDDVAARIDPLANRSLSEIVTMAQDRYREVDDLSHVENYSVRLLGNQTTLAKYESTATRGGESVTVVVYVAAVRHNGDVVRAIAVLPRSADDRPTVRSLVEAIEH